MSGGGKGGKQTTSVKIPAWLESAAKDNIARANQAAGIGYTPYFGPDVAGFTPMQEAAFANTAAGASAFGLGAPAGSAVAGVPAAQTFAGGVRGYSSAPLYEQALAELQSRNPAQFAAITSMFNTPQGMPPSLSMGQPAPPAGAPAAGFAVGGMDGGGGGMGVASRPSGAGFTSIRDMFNGGGVGRSGFTFSGGPLSGTLNRVGVSPIGSRSSTATKSKSTASGPSGGSKSSGSKSGSGGGSKGRR